MRPRPDAGLEVALEQRQRVLQDAQQVHSEHERRVQEQAHQLAAAEARVRMVLMQIDAAQRPAMGVTLPVAVLGDLERLLDWCEVQVIVQQDRLKEVRSEAEVARGALAVAHQQVRALELVLAARKAEREEKKHRAELRLADETAARVHARNAGARP
jgi:flagellar biosynthesis chaperone FliJ